MGTGVLEAHKSSEKHLNAAGQSRESASKGRMQLTLYLWKKIGMLWKSYGIFVLGICTNPGKRTKKNPLKQNELIPSLSSPLPDLDPEIY